jgi:predicted dithiol-disulfide oxidoreductase (DUF899 family)
MAKERQRQRLMRRRKRNGHEEEERRDIFGGTRKKRDIQSCAMARSRPMGHVQKLAGADGYNGVVAHLAQRDTALVTVCRRPWKNCRHGTVRWWSYPWVSSGDGDFNLDFSVSFRNEDQKSGGSKRPRGRADVCVQTIAGMIERE